MDPLIPFTRSTPSLTSGTSDTVSIPMTDDSGLGTLRPRSPALIELSDDGNTEPAPRKPLAFASGAGVTPAEKLRSLLRQMESDVRDPPPQTAPPRRPATPQLIDAPISSSSSNVHANDEEDSDYSPPTPPPRINNPYYARDEPEPKAEAGPSRPRRLPSRAVALQAAVTKLPEQEAASNGPTALETFITRHHDVPESWKPKHPSERLDKSGNRSERDSSATVRQFSSATPRRRHTPRRTTIEAPPDNSMAFAAGIQDPSFDIDDDSSMPAPWEDESSELPDRSRGSGDRRPDRSSNSARRELGESVDMSPERPKNRFQARRFMKANLSDELPESPEPPRRSQRTTRSESPNEPESRTVRAERSWMRRGTRSPTGSFATAPQISPQAALDTSLPQVPDDSSDEDTSAKRNRANMFRPSSESPKSRIRDQSSRAGTSGAYVDAASRSRDWASQVSRSQPFDAIDDEVDESLDEPEPAWARRSRQSQHEIDEADHEAEPPRRMRSSRDRSSAHEDNNEHDRIRGSRNRGVLVEVDEELDEPEPPRRLRVSRSQEVIQIDEEERVERSIDDDHIRVSRHRDMSTRYADGSTEERHQSSQSVYEPLRWSKSERSIEEPDVSEKSQTSSRQSRSRYDTPDESHPSTQHTRSRYDTPDETQPSVQHSRSRYGTPDETQPSLQHSRSRYDAPEESSVLKHSRSQSQATARHSRSRYDTSERPLRHSRSEEDMAEDDSRTSLHKSQLRGFSFPNRKRTRSDEAGDAIPPTPSPPKPLVSSHLQPQQPPATLNTPVRPGAIRASALRKSARATPTPNRVRWSPNIEDSGRDDSTQSFQIDLPRSTTPPPSTSPPTSPPRTPAPPAPSEPQSPQQPLATPIREHAFDPRTPHPPGWLPDSPGQTPVQGNGFSTPAPAQSQQTAPGSAMRTPHPPGWFNPTAGPSTPGAKFFSTPAPKEKAPEPKLRGVGVGAGFSTPVQPQQPFLATPKPPGAWGWTPVAGSRLRNEITLDSSQSSVESDGSRTFERSLLGSGDVHRLKLSPRKSPKSSPSTSPTSTTHPLAISTKSSPRENGREAGDDSLTTPTKPRSVEERTPLSEKRFSQSVNASFADESFMDDSFLQADTSVMARVRSFLSPSKDAELQQARDRLAEAAAKSKASRREIADAQQAWLAALAALPRSSTSTSASASAGAQTADSSKDVEGKTKGRSRAWPMAYWVIIAVVEVLVMWAVFRLTVDWVDAERSRTSSALVQRLPSGLGVFRKTQRSSNFFDVLELLGLSWAPTERKWDVPT